MTSDCPLYSTADRFCIIDCGDHEALLTIHEGRYHQVKRMFAAIGNKVEQLHREKIGGLQLPADLAEGSYKQLTALELKLIAN